MNTLVAKVTGRSSIVEMLSTEQIERGVQLVKKHFIRNLMQGCPARNGRPGMIPFSAEEAEAKWQRLEPDFRALFASNDPEVDKRFGGLT